MAAKSMTCWCEGCKAMRVHEILPCRRKDDYSWTFSCRPVKPDYRTVACQKCGYTATYDFATD